MGIPVFGEIADREFSFSQKAVDQLSAEIKFQTSAYSFDWLIHNQNKSSIRCARKIVHQEKLDELGVRMSNDERSANDLAQMKNA